ncbi:type VI secretion system-associated protein TagO [Marinivivus vitaminiproducens]|uniref:type VI secretion system-associated protein TagO n=1 Tax=Marinivivus vitaminiproducens TaxID=3035935 RepID=UPI0027992E40|nr:type VI secretion system-associated protein TagO [Geminicoccaceae bacterium SCSIO 64248]
MRFGYGLVALALAACLGANAHAVEDGEVVRCAGLDGDAAKLACLEDLAATARVAIAAENQPAESRWRVVSEASEISDRPNVYLTLRANDPVDDLLAGPVVPTLWLQCVEGKPAALVNFGFTLGGGTKEVTARLDHEDPVVLHAPVTSDFHAIGSFRQETVSQQIARMLGHDQLVVRTTSINHSPVTATFPLTGMEGAIQPLREVCPL